MHAHSNLTSRVTLDMARRDLLSTGTQQDAEGPAFSSSLWSTTISSIIFSVSPSYSKCRWKPYKKAVWFQGFLQLWPMTLECPLSSAERIAENSRLIHLLIFFSVCVFWLVFIIIWQKDCPSLRHEYGSAVDVWELYNLKITIIITITLSLT